MTKSILMLCLVLALASATAVAGDDALRIVRVEGWIVNEQCSKKNADFTDGECSPEKDAKSAFFVAADGEVYPVYAEHVSKAVAESGKRVAVLGSIDPEGNLRIGQFMPPKPSRKS